MFKLVFIILGPCDEEDDDEEETVLRPKRKKSVSSKNLQIIQISCTLSNKADHEIQQMSEVYNFVA